MPAVAWTPMIVSPRSGDSETGSGGSSNRPQTGTPKPNDDIASQPASGMAIFEIHATAGMVLLGLVVIHVLGTLKHTLIDKDGNLFRMLPFGTPKA